MYAHDGLADVSTVGTSLLQDIKSAGIAPSAASWDFLTLALAVNVADHAVERNTSSDGWSLFTSPTHSSIWSWTSSKRFAS
jgi:hypothetical protein